MATGRNKGRGCLLGCFAGGLTAGVAASIAALGAAGVGLWLYTQPGGLSSLDFSVPDLDLGSAPAADVVDTDEPDQVDPDEVEPAVADVEPEPEPLAPDPPRSASSSAGSSRTTGSTRSSSTTSTSRSGSSGSTAGSSTSRSGSSASSSGSTSSSSSAAPEPEGDADAYVFPEPEPERPSTRVTYPPIHDDSSARRTSSYNVRVEGPAQVVLVDDFGRWPVPELIPAGKYSIVATWPGGTPRDVGRINVKELERYTIACKATKERCSVR